MTKTTPTEPSDATSETAPNEILVAAKEAKDHAEAAAKAALDRARGWPLAKIGMGVIGSAAVAAAVLFANQNRKK